MKNQTRNRVKSFGFGLATLAFITFILYVSAKAPSGLPWQRTTPVKAEFDNVATLQAGDAVRQNSTRIGKVASVEYVDGRAVVTLRLSGHREVHADARAAIYDESTLAKKFVEFYPGTAGELTGPIRDTATVGATDIDDLIAVLDSETRSKLSTSLTELGGGAAGHGEGLQLLLREAPDLLIDADRVVGAATAPDADLGGLVRRADQFARDFKGQDERLAHLMTTSAETLDAFAADNGQDLKQTVHEAPSTLEQAEDTLDELNPTLRDTREAMEELRPGADALGDATPDLRGLLRESVTPLDRLPEVSKVAVPAIVDLTALAHDARPLAPKLSTTLSDLAPILEELGPYSKDIVSFFGHAYSLVSQVVGPNEDSHVARLGVALPGTSIVGGYLVQDPGLVRYPYPEPGTAYTHTTDDIPSLTPLGSLADLSFLSQLPGVKLPGYDGGQN